MATKERIREMPLEQVMGERFGRYSKYIIQERALPDIRDGLKPVQRRILYAMYQDGNTYDKPFKKAAKAVGNIMGNFHPHGDSSIYGALVHLSQDWKMREPLVEMHGNNGSMDGDGPAAMRYTESRLNKISNMLLQDIDKQTVKMVLNFDDSEYEPTVLPARFPNLLVNGSTGISAGYATEIPPHNLGEVIDATIYLLKHPDASLADLMQFVKGPDFPTGAIVMGTQGIKEAYETGRGRIQVRAKTSIQEIRGHRQEIVTTEIPFDVNKALLVKKIDEIRLNKEIDG
ncbi:MAG: DNA topoisomerase IV subunit A, partial [Lactobacillus sp.]|nr:DNA topoisomerase IV subunit A [Lactobacillus sp.]